MEQLGWEVVIGDPNFAPMYADRNRKVKTDRRDAEALLMACEKGNYRAAHRLSDAARRLRLHVQSRKVLVQARSRGIVRARSSLHGLGLPRLPQGAERFADNWRTQAFPPDVAGELSAMEPVIKAIDVLTSGIERYDDHLEELATQVPEVQRLTSVPGIASVTAATWVATLDTPDRFASGEDVASYLGLVPSVWSSSESHRQGSITKKGPSELRSLLVEAGWNIYSGRCKGAEPLRQWALKCAQRRGENVAVTALARRLAVVLFALWRDEETFDVSRLGAGAAIQV